MNAGHLWGECEQAAYILTTKERMKVYIKSCWVFAR